MIAPYLQQFNALRECRSVKAGFAACGIYVALDGVVVLATRLVESAEVHPGGRVAVVQLNGADVGLQRVHGLVLLLIQHPGVRRDACQGGAVTLKALHYINSINYKPEVLKWWRLRTHNSSSRDPILFRTRPLSIMQVYQSY